MAKFRSDNDEVRYYPYLGVLVSPGEEVDLPADTQASGLTLVETPAKKVKATATDDTATPTAEQPEA